MTIPWRSLAIGGATAIRTSDLATGGQRRAAKLLLAHGADLNGVPDYAEGTPLDQAGSIGL